MAHNTLLLPATIIGPADLARAKRDLDSYAEAQHQSELRAKKTGKSETVHAGRVISELAALNECNLEVSHECTELLKQLETALQAAPTVTMSFAVDPSAAFLAKLVDWLRTSIHPQVLVRVGLQPNIAAGCMLKTASRIYDFSLRQKLVEQRPLLIDRFKAGMKADTGVAIQAPTQEAAA